MYASKVFKILLLALLPIFAFSQQQINESRPVNKDVKLKISNVSGSVDIIGWDKNEVKIEGTLEKNVKKLDIIGGKSRLKIKVKIPKLRFSGKTSAYLTIYVPTKSLLDISAVSAKITAKKIIGEEAEVSSVSGSIIVESKNKKIDLETVSGKINLQCECKEAEVSSVSGSLLINGNFLELEGSSVSGDIRVEANMIESGKFNTTSGDIEFLGNVKGNDKFEFESISGDVDISVPKNISAEFDISSMSGDIKNKLTKEKPDEKKYGPGSNLNFITAEGNLMITASTLSGHIILYPL